MPRRLRFTDEALADLSDVRNWMTQQGSGLAARRRLAAIRADIGLLKQHPCLYPVVAHPGVRELPCTGGYRALYEVTPDTGINGTAGDVMILRIYGPGQDRGTFLRFEP